MSIETPQFFPNRDGKRLYGVLHQPDSSAGADRHCAVVYCAPLFEEKLWSHRVAVNLARFLAGNGVSVLRFDYYGDGESEGLFQESSVASRVRDIEDAVLFCRQQAPASTTYLVGLCYGATLALCAAPLSREIAGVVAWQPVMQGERYIGEALRGHLAGQMVVHRKVVHDREALIAQLREGQTVNVEGYEISKALYEEMLAVDLAALLRNAAKPVLVQQISPAESTERQYAELETLRNRCVEFQKVREVKFWVQQKSIFAPCHDLFSRTTAWLSHTAPALRASA